MENGLMSIELSETQFKKISQMTYRLCGIQLPNGKQQLVKARLLKRLHALNLGSFEQYMKYIERDGADHELVNMIDFLTTNKTSFFREFQHFDFLRQHVLPGFKGGRLRLWSAGCSSGEEPYSIAMLLREEIANIDRYDVRILATDISTRVLEGAREGVYEENTLRDVSPKFRQKYFSCVRRELPSTYRVKDNLKALIQFARLNLMENWPMKGPFDVIFCRNVMIYFDKETRKELIHRFWELLGAGGYLFVGHSESLTTLSHELAYVQPAVYIK
ncbi:MAG: hypothetical protein GWP06_04820 [Actinobacteria bacterium]|nr:hypothetical protein [Actinomycetota bacterium]